MKRVLFMSGNAIERRVVKEQLEGSGDGYELLVTRNHQQTLEALEQEGLGLCILDLPRFDLASCNLVTEIRKCRAELPILVLSTGSQEEVVGYAWRLGVQDYLLKPCRTSWLLAAVRAMVIQSGQAREKGTVTLSRQREQYLDQLGGLLRSLEYKKCIRLAKEYIDFIHEKADNVEAVRMESVAFAEGILELGLPMGEAVQWKLAGCLKPYQKRFDQQGKKYDTLVVIEKMIGIIFDDIEGNQCYDSYDLNQGKRILNYVDRNVKRALSLDQMAEYANMSSCYFSKLFKKLTGRNYISYVTDEKVEYAKYMLRETDLPVVNIACELAYRETNYFSKAFKKNAGLSPTEYREQCTAIPPQRGRISL